MKPATKRGSIVLCSLVLLGISVHAQSDFLPRGKDGFAIYGGHISGSGNSGTVAALSFSSNGMRDVGYSFATVSSGGSDSRSISAFGSQVLAKSDEAAPEALAVDLGFSIVSSGGSSVMYLSLGPSVYANLIGNNGIRMLFKLGAAFHKQLDKGSSDRYGYRRRNDFGSSGLGLGLILGSEKTKIKFDMEFGVANGEASAGLFLGFVFIGDSGYSRSSGEFR